MDQLVVQVVVLLGTLILDLEDQLSHLLTENHQPLKVMRAVLPLALMVLLVVVVLVVPEQLLQTCMDILVVSGYKLHLVVVLITTMLVVAVVLLTQIMEQEEEDLVAVVMVETLVRSLLLSDLVMQMLTLEEVEVVHMVTADLVLLL
tara:strand:+ start:148 stop:588 length:441 start_codon:yes stop_codon:yes gene_type:complete